MRRTIPWLALTGLLSGLTSAACARTPAIEVRAISPEPGRLAAQQALYVRVAYDYSAPLRFQARGYHQGTQRKQLYMNTAPAYPAGQGEAIVWLSGGPGAQIDEVRIRVMDAKWHALLDVSIPCVAEWRSGAATAPTAPWAAQMMAAQDHLPPVDARTDESWLARLISTVLVWLVPVAFLSVPGYPILQIVAWLKLRGPWRLLSALPLSFMLPVYAFCLFALSRGSNLWPLFAIYASPLALLITGIILFIGLRRRRAQAPTG
ncbi:MAG: hypothetical protein IT582_04650 [Opitutaceae bacterium]|nr:hypothetical protein [Opitutaceae bacterium]